MEFFNFEILTFFEDPNFGKKVLLGYGFLDVHQPGSSKIGIIFLIQEIITILIFLILLLKTIY